MSYNPYRPKAIQNQQKAQARSQGKPQQQQQPKQQEGKPKDFGGFDSLVLDQRCRIKTGTGEVIEGLITATSKFWYLVNVNGQIVIVNKAYVMMVMPIQPQNNNTNTAGGSNGGEQPSRSR